jgi:hypothetical protein
MAVTFPPVQKVWLVVTRYCRALIERLRSMG